MNSLTPHSHQRGKYHTQAHKVPFQLFVFRIHPIWGAQSHKAAVSSV